MKLNPSSLKKLPVYHTLNVLQNAFPTVNFPTYKEIAPLAAQLRRSTIDSAGSNSSMMIKPLFINKDMQTLNMQDIQRLIEIDSKYRDVKFTLLTNEKELTGCKINPILRTILNNGMSYTIHYNQGHHVMNTLNLMLGNQTNNPVRNNSLMEIREQVYLQVLGKKATNDTQKDSLIFKQIDIDPTFIYTTEVPFQYNDIDLTFIVPSLSILPRLFALGIHKDHPQFDQLIGNRVKIPEIKSNPILFTEITDKELIKQDVKSDIIGLFPHHIKFHRDLFPDLNFNYIQPGKLIKYEGEFYDYLTLNDIMVTKFQNLKSHNKLIEVIPFVAQNYYESVVNHSSNSLRIKGKRLTKVMNNHVIFDETKNDCLYSIEQSKELVQGNNMHYDLSNKPLHRVSFREVLEFINFKQSYKYEGKVGFSLDADLLRGYLLSQTSNGKISHLNYHKLYHINENLEELTFLCEKWCIFNEVSIEFDADKLTQMDMYLLHGYVHLTKSKQNIIQFTRIHLVSYLLYLDLLTLEQDPNQFINSHRFFNFIFLKFFNTEVRQHYPNLYNYYRIKFNEQCPSHANGIGKKYIIPQSLMSRNHEKTLFKFLFTIKATLQHYPDLYVFKLFIKQKRKSFKNDQYVGKKYIKRLIERFNGKEGTLLPENTFSNTVFFKSDIPGEAIIFKYIPLSRDKLVERLIELDFKLMKNESFNQLILRIRSILINDLDLFKIRDRFTIDFVDDLLESLDPLFIEQYEQYLERKKTGDINSDLNGSVIDDYEARINPFFEKKGNSLPLQDLSKRE